MKLHLISPPMTVLNKDWHYPQVPPIGIAYLAACAGRAGHQVGVTDGLGEALDCYHEFIGGRYINGLSIEEVTRSVDADADVIGLSVMFSKQWPLARRLLEALKDAFPKTPLVIGGEHVTAVPQEVFDSAPVDFAVLGEGEETFLELIEALSQAGQTGLGNIEGLAYRDERGRTVCNPPRQRRRDLDSIPWPAWDLLPVRNYIEANRFQEVSDRRVMILLGTRGCPYRCRFCSNPLMWTTSFYMRDPKDIVDEIEAYRSEYGATEFQFQDLTFVINRGWVLRVAEEICRRNLKITWKLPGGTRSEAFDAELLTALSASGCTQLAFAPESGSKRVLEAMLKKAEPARFIELGKIIRRNRIDLSVTAFIIIGSPEETLSDLLQTYRFIARLALVGYDSILCSRFTCYPGSEYHQRYLDRGLIKYDDEYFLDLDLSVTSLRHGRSWHPRWSERQIASFITIAYMLFFIVHYLSRPLRMLRSVAAVLGNKPKTRLELIFTHTFAPRVRRLWARLRGGGAARVAQPGHPGIKGPSGAPVPGSPR